MRVKEGRNVENGRLETNKLQQINAHKKYLERVLVKLLEGEKKMYLMSRNK